jgi:hypothetical protein
MISPYKVGLSKPSTKELSRSSHRDLLLTSVDIRNATLRATGQERGRFGEPRGIDCAAININ